MAPYLGTHGVGGLTIVLPELIIVNLQGNKGFTASLQFVILSLPYITQFCLSSLFLGPANCNRLPASALVSMHLVISCKTISHRSLS
jgi:hypothetical protein